MHVLKFGGTSLGDPERIRTVASIIEEAPKPCIVVLSANSGVTDQLQGIVEDLYSKERASARERIHGLKDHLRELVNGLFKSSEGKKEGKELLEAHVEHLLGFTKVMITVHEEKEILAQGELISTGIFFRFLREQGNAPAMLPALDFMRIDDHGEPDNVFIQEHLANILEKNPDPEVFITQGFICRNEFGGIDNLKRGGSDHTASLIGAAIKADEVDIWTDIDGIHNNDPRVVDGTYPVRKMSFDEAAELAYFGAKILHPSSVRPAKLANIPVRLKNTLDKDAPGTVIQESNEDGVGKIRAIAAKDGIIALKIKSGRMLMAYGFLKKVFEVFEVYRTPIDMITTSEVAVSLTIDDDTYLDHILEDLRKFGQVEVDRNQCIICIVGDMVGENTGKARAIFSSLSDVPIRMISYGGSKNNISLLIDSRERKKALNALNEGVFKSGTADVQ